MGKIRKLWQNEKADNTYVEKISRVMILFAIKLGHVLGHHRVLVQDVGHLVPIEQVVVVVSHSTTAMIT